jgi:hypothetical protein
VAAALRSRHRARLRRRWTTSHAQRPQRPLTYHAYQGEDFAGDEEGTHDPDEIFLRGLECTNCVLVRDSQGGLYPSDHYFQMALCANPNV